MSIIIGVDEIDYCFACWIATTLVSPVDFIDDPLAMKKKKNIKMMEGMIISDNLFKKKKKRSSVMALQLQNFLSSY